MHFRIPINYDYHCSVLSGPLGAAESVINYPSPLNKIDGFHVTNGQLPQDIMHVLLEGVLHLEIRMMLRCYMQDEQYLSLDTFN